MISQHTNALVACGIVGVLFLFLSTYPGASLRFKRTLQALSVLFLFPVLSQVWLMAVLG